MSEACRAVDCALLGGETAEMPGVYMPGATDVAGTIVGVADRGALWPQTERLRAGDLLVGLAGDSPHTNGYSLIRLLLERHEPDAEMLEYLLTPHRCYLGDIDRLQQRGIRPQGAGTHNRRGSGREPPAGPARWTECADRPRRLACAPGVPNVGEVGRVDR